MVMRMRTVIATLKGWCQCESILIWASLWWTKSLEPKISKWICFCFCHVRSKRQNKNWKITGMLVGFTTSLGPATRTFFSLLRWLVLVFGYCNGPLTLLLSLLHSSVSSTGVYIKDEPAGSMVTKEVNLLLGTRGSRSLGHRLLDEPNRQSKIDEAFHRYQKSRSGS